MKTIKWLWLWLANSSNVRFVFKVLGTVVSTVGANGAADAFSEEKVIPVADAVATIAGALPVILAWAAGLASERKAKEALKTIPPISPAV